MLNVYNAVHIYFYIVFTYMKILEMLEKLFIEYGI